MRKVFVIALIGLLLVASLDAAKKSGKEAKGKKGAKAEKVKEPKVKAEKKAKAVEEPVVEAEPEEAAVEEPVHEEAPALCPFAASHGVHHAPLDAVHHQQRLIKPKSLKVLSQYEQCKLECKKQRDQVTAQQYVEQLKTELAAAEQALIDQAAAVEAHAEPAAIAPHDTPAVEHHAEPAAAHPAA
ncbi:unnamed protein product, partial [Mesorhabditis spiculigera]